jgi:hypothetical protein
MKDRQQREDARLIEAAAEDLFLFVRDIAEAGYESLDDVREEAEGLIHNLGLVGVKKRHSSETDFKEPHEPGCPRCQFWDAGDWEAPCCCEIR